MGPKFDHPKPFEVLVEVEAVTLATYSLPKDLLERRDPLGLGQLLSNASSSTPVSRLSMCDRSHAHSSTLGSSTMRVGG